MASTSENRTLEEIIKECREYIQLKNRSNMERNPEPGTPVYLISKNWLKVYKQSIFYAEVKRNNKPNV
jgi:hypothetical protein